MSLGGIDFPGGESTWKSGGPRRSEFLVAGCGFFLANPPCRCSLCVVCGLFVWSPFLFLFFWCVCVCVFSRLFCLLCLFVAYVVGRLLVVV